MVILGREKLTQFIRKHSDTREWIENWVAYVESDNCKWATPHDVKASYVRASILANNVVIFDVKGTKYRLETQIAYKNGTVFVRWIGTHAEYTKRYK